MIRVAIAGASGYTGGELLRLLLFHADVEVRQATSERLAGRFVHNAHPNLRGATRLKFVSAAELKPCDVLFLCLPHGQSMARIDEFRALAPRIVDLSADFRLRDPAGYRRWYRRDHPRPDLLDAFVYGVPELHREAIAGADLVACAGCNATATILALRPFYRRGLVESAVVEVKAGSSEGGEHVERCQPSSGAQRRGALLPPLRTPARGGDGAGARHRRHPLLGHVDRDGAGHPRDLPRVSPRAGHGEGRVEVAARGLRGRALRAHREGNAAASTATPSRSSSRARTTATSASSATRTRTGSWSSAPSTTS